MEHLPIFVYGTLKRGYCNSHVWPCEPARIREAMLTGARMYDAGSFPAVVRDSVEIADHVRGELWYVDAIDFVTAVYYLDRLEGYREECEERSMYLRRIVEVWDAGLMRFVQAYVYLWNHDVGDMPRVVKPLDPLVSTGVGEWIEEVTACGS